MSNGEFCCAIGVCCPPLSEARRAALIHELSAGLKALPSGDRAVAACADWLIAHVDMLPAGTLDLGRSGCAKVSLAGMRSACGSSVDGKAVAAHCEEWLKASVVLLPSGSVDLARMADVMRQARRHEG